MMKRMGLSRFKSLNVTRKVQQCLRLETLGANGDVNRCDNEEKEECQCKSDDCTLDDQRNKNNLLNAIRKKWRNSKRKKLRTGCQCANVACCHSKTRKQKSCEKGIVWPILRCQNHQTTEDSTRLIASDNENDTCSCLKPFALQTDDSVSGAAPTLLSTTNLCSFPCCVDDLASSLASNTESVDDCLSRVNTEAENLEPNGEIFIPRVGSLTQELNKLSKHGWYWGPINRNEAESKLTDQPDGSFLVRDSSDDRYILSLSFRSYGRTLHTHIEHSHGLFSFYTQPEPEGLPSVVELIEQSMCHSQSGVFCYSRSRSPGAPSFPVRLTRPISRFTHIRSLQYLCRFVIRQNTRYDHIQKLPLPPRIKGYLQEGHY